MAEARMPHRFDAGSASQETVIDTGTNFSVNVESSENVIIGNFSKLVVCSKSKPKSRGHRKKERISPKYPVTDSKEMPTMNERLEIKGKVGQCWKELGTHLGFENAELEQMEINFHDDVSERVYQIITKWQQRVPEEATKAALATVFMKMKRGDLADILTDE